MLIKIYGLRNPAKFLLSSWGTIAKSRIKTGFIFKSSYWWFKTVSARKQLQLLMTFQQFFCKKLFGIISKMWIIIFSVTVSVLVFS